MGALCHSIGKHYLFTCALQAVEEWSQRLEKERTESAAALAEARAAASASEAWKLERGNLLSSQQKLAAQKAALEKKLAAALAQKGSVTEIDAASVAQLSSRLEYTLREKEKLVKALESAKAAQCDEAAARKDMEEMQASAAAEQAAAARLLKETEYQAAVTAAELAQQRACLADAEKLLVAEKERAAAAQAEKEKLASELELLREERRLTDVEEARIVKTAMAAEVETEKEKRAAVQAAAEAEKQQMADELERLREEGCKEEAARMRAAEVAAAEKALLQAELAEAADARTALQAQLAALAAEVHGLRSAAAAPSGLPFMSLGQLRSLMWRTYSESSRTCHRDFLQMGSCTSQLSQHCSRWSLRASVFYGPGMTACSATGSAKIIRKPASDEAVLQQKGMGLARQRAAAPLAALRLRPLQHPCSGRPSRGPPGSAASVSAGTPPCGLPTMRYSAWPHVVHKPPQNAGGTVQTLLFGLLFL